MPGCILPTLDASISGKAGTSLAPIGLTFKQPQLIHKSVLELRRRLTVSFAADSSKPEVKTLRPRAPDAPRSEASEGEQVVIADQTRNLDVAAVRPGTSPSVRQLGDALARGDWRLAASITDSLNSLGNDIAVEDATRFITAFCRANNFSRAWKLYQLVPRWLRLKIYAYKQLIFAAFQEGEPYKALQVFRDMQQAGLEPNLALWANVIILLCRHKGPRRVSPCDRWAYELWDELRASGTLLDAPAIAAGMNACIGVGRLEEAKGLLENMRERGLGVDARAYNVMLKGYARRGDVQKMRDMLEEMQRCGIEPSIASYNTLINVYVRRGDMPEAQRLLRKARAAQATPTAITYNSLLKGFAEAGDLDSAEALLEEMREQSLQPNLVTYSTLIDGWVKAGAVERASQLLQEMRRQGLKPNAITYNTLLKGYCSVTPASLPAELDVLQQMSRDGVRPNVDTFNILMTARLRNGDCVAVPCLFKQLLQTGYCPDSISYTTLISALSRLGRFDDAVRAFQEMERDERVAVDLPALNCLVDALARSGQLAAAEQALERALYLTQSSGQPPPISAFGAVMCAYARQRQLEPALQTVQRFYQLGGTPDAPMFDILVDLAVRTGQFKRAMQVVRAMERVGAQVDKQRIKGTLEQMIKRQANAPSSSKKAPRRNENLERFKFWLGLPNRYYADDSDD